MDLSMFPCDNPTFADPYTEESIYNFPVIYKDTEQYYRNEFPNFPEEFYPILALRASGMKWGTFKKLLRQSRKDEEKILRKKSKQIPFTIRNCKPGEKFMI